MKLLVGVFLTVVAWSSAADLPSNCEVVVETQYGRVCGKLRYDTNGSAYASFRGMRYALPPIGELRFGEPQPPEPYEGIFDASEHGPICPQYNDFYGPLLQPTSSSEDCLRINVHVPLSSLPDGGTAKPLLPVCVFIHGGSFSYGSGDADLHGPEYLMAGKEVILVTLNYRLGPFGFLSLFSKEIPGNAGLRDAVFALKWVQSNMKNFGGDPAQVTLGGQSAGAAMAHLLSISPAVQELKLFNKAIILSGTSIGGFFSVTEAYARNINTGFLLAAGINILQSPEEIHKDLVKAPLDKLIEANKALLNKLGLVTFAPVVEKPAANFTTIIPKDPEDLLNEGHGKNVATWIGFCDNEAQALKKRLQEVNIETSLRLLPSRTIPMNIKWASKLLTIPVLVGKMMNEYFNNTLITLEKFLPALTDGYFKYPTMRVTEKRINSRAPTTFISEFAHYSASNPIKLAQNRDWPGAGHSEDITYFFRVNSILGNDTTNELDLDTEDSRMKSWMTNFVMQFVKTGSPPSQNQLSGWPAIEDQFKFQYIDNAQYDYRSITPYLQEKRSFFNQLNRIGRGI